MINPPDELLADLQTALPPELPVTVPTSGHQDNGQAIMEENLYDLPEDLMQERASVASTVSEGRRRDNIEKEGLIGRE